MGLTGADGGGQGGVMGNRAELVAKIEEVADTLAVTALFDAHGKAGTAVGALTIAMVRIAVLSGATLEDLLVAVVAQYKQASDADAADAGAQAAKDAGVQTEMFERN